MKVVQNFGVASGTVETDDLRGLGNFTEDLPQVSSITFQTYKNGNGVAACVFFSGRQFSPHKKCGFAIKGFCQYECQSFASKHILFDRGGTFKNVQSEFQKHEND